MSACWAASRVQHSLYLCINPLQHKVYYTMHIPQHFKTLYFAYTVFSTETTAVLNSINQVALVKKDTTFLVVCTECLNRPTIKKPSGITGLREMKIESKSTDVTPHIILPNVTTCKIFQGNTATQVNSNSFKMN